MCNWFSCVSVAGKMYYFNEEHRQVVCDGGSLACKVGANPITTRDELDSHSGICSFFGLDCDKVNKYEFRPLDRKWTVDQLNVADDSVKIERQVRRMDLMKLAPPEFVPKPLFHPFTDAARKRATAADIELLRQWASVRDSVGASVWASVGDGASVRDSVWASVWDGASVRDSVWDSVWDGANVWDSVWDSVGASVWASVWAYTGSFFCLEKWKYIDHEEGVYPFQCCVDLWERGLVPSFDGKHWRLHGHGGKVIKTIHKDNLRR